MKVLSEIKISNKKDSIPIFFGIPTTEEEREKMFRLRYRIYVEKKHYIPGYLCKNDLEIDEYDKSNSCTYFIAMANNEMVGTIRVIRMNPLPIFRHYFKFKEPSVAKSIPWDKKIEIGRFISTGRVGEKFLPRHLIPLGLFWSVKEFAIENDIKMGYGAIKQYIYKKLDRINFPLKKIDQYKVIYKKGEGDPLENFFTEEDPVIPVYFLKEEVDSYLEDLFKNSNVFEQVSRNKFIFKGNSRIIIYLASKFLFTKKK